MIRQIVSIIYSLIEVLKKARREWGKEKIEKELKHRDDKETTDNLNDLLR